MATRFVHDGNSIDYTPASAVTAGDVVVQGELVGVAKLDIAANALGALTVTGVFDFPKATEVEDEFGLRLSAHATDFLIPADELAPTFGQPQAGDQIVADGALFEVMSLAGQGHWRWSDPYRQTVRIHTKEVGAA